MSISPHTVRLKQFDELLDGPRGMPDVKTAILLVFQATIAGLSPLSSCAVGARRESVSSRLDVTEGLKRRAI